MVMASEHTVTEYLAAATRYADDLRGEARDELVEAIETAIREVGAELGDGLREHLGPPNEFVAELRSASGLPPYRASRQGTSWLGTTLERLRAGGRRLRAHWWTAWLIDLGRDLRPAWWVLRGHALAWLLAWLASGWPTVHWLWLVPVPNVGGSALASVAIAGALIVASVGAGRRVWTGWRRLAVVVVNVVAALALLGLADQVRFGEGPTVGIAYNPSVTMVAPEQFGASMTLIDGVPVVAVASAADGHTVIIPASGSEVIDLWSDLAAQYGPEQVEVLLADGRRLTFGGAGELQAELVYGER